MFKVRLVDESIHNFVTFGGQHNTLNMTGVIIFSIYVIEVGERIMNSTGSVCMARSFFSSL